MEAIRAKHVAEIQGFEDRRADSKKNSRPLCESGEAQEDCGNAASARYKNTDEFRNKNRDYMRRYRKIGVGAEIELV